MRRWIGFLVLALVASAALAARSTTVAWDNSPSWPAGTTVEVCGNGNVCLSGVTGTQATLALPVNPGQVIEVKARANGPSSMTCTPAPECRSSPWATLSATWPHPGVKLSAKLVESSWNNSDVGAVLAPGSTLFGDGTFTVRGYGLDIWDTADAFHYAYLPVTGDGSIVARVASISLPGSSDGWDKAGVMIRETLTPGSKHAMVVLTNENGVAFQRRLTTGATSAHTAGVATGAPYWVKLTRAGNSFTAHQSSNGTAWTQIGTAVTIAMSADVFAGLAVIGNETPCTAVFGNVATSLALRALK